MYGARQEDEVRGGGDLTITLTITKWKRKQRRYLKKSDEKLISVKYGRKERRKEAELLLKNDLPVQYIKGFVVYNLKAKQLLLSMGIDEENVIVKPNYYF